jgi:transmembrane sensor
MKSPTPTRAEIEAAEWLTTLNQRLVTLEQRTRFEEWLRADPEHARAYERSKSVFQVASSLSTMLEETIEEDRRERESRRRRMRNVAMAASLVLSVGAAFFLAREFDWPGRGDRFETSTAQVKDVQLEDGTLVTLGAASGIAVDFGKRERRVKLIRGQAFFEVARDTSRPFLVTAGDTVVRVLGTKFDVHYGQQAVRVAVVEGRVEVMRAADLEKIELTPAPASKEVLTVGDTAVATESGDIVISSHPNKEDFGAWRQGRLVYVDARLTDIVSDMDRYFDGELELADEALGERQLTITFRANEIDRALELLEAALPLRAVRTSQKKIVLTRRASE